MFLLHAHGAEEAYAHGFFDQVVLHGALEVAKLIPFLFLTYLLIEYIEHKAGERAERFISRSGNFAPVFGALVGAVPQCGFSAAASSLYTGGVISVGTLIAVFLSTSDEMLPILISGSFSPLAILAIVGYKTLVAMVIGVVINLILRGARNGSATKSEGDHHHCHDHTCGGGIFSSALLHTLKIGGFVLLITICINGVIFLVGEEKLGAIIPSVPVVGHLVAAVFGLIPNCAASVALTTLAKGGIISVGEMLSGLFSGAGIGLAVLVRTNKSKKQNLLIILAMVVIGAVFGYIADLVMPDILAW